MNKSLFIFVLSFLLLGINSCIYDESPSYKPFYHTNIENPIGMYLIQSIQQQPNNEKLFSETLHGAIPLFEETKLSTSSRYGTYFFVPYLLNEQIDGCIIYPINEAISLEDENHFNKLGIPLNLNSYTLNEEIPVTERYLYAAEFAMLESKGYLINSCLTDFFHSIENNDNMLQVNAIDDFNRTLSQPDTRASTYTHAAIINYQYTTTSVGFIENGHPGVYTVSAKSIQKYLMEILNNDHRYISYYIQSGYYGTNSFRIEFKFQYRVDDRNLRFIIDDFSNKLNNEYFKTYGITMNYSYYAEYYEIGSNNNLNAYGSINRGHVSGGLDLPHPGGNNPDNKKRKKPRNPTADQSKEQEEIREEIEDSITIFLGDNGESLKKEAEMYERFKDSTYHFFKEQVHKLPQIEHAMSFQELNGILYGKSYAQGSEDFVSNEIFNNTIWKIHNHPNQTPPSFLDLISAGEATTISSKFQASLIYCHKDEGIYIIFITNQEKATKFANNLKSSIDWKTHSYSESSKVRNILKSHKDTYIKLDSSQQEIYKVALILSYFDSGMKLSYLNKDGKNTLYDVKQDEDGFYIPTITKTK